MRNDPLHPLVFILLLCLSISSASAQVIATPAVVPLTAAAATPNPVAAPRFTEADEARIVGAAQECTPYYFPATSNVVGTYPTIWQTADLSGSGISAEDKGLFKAINSSIPNIAPHGTRSGNFTGVNLAAFAGTCWWSSTLCTTPNAYGLPDDIIQSPPSNSWLLSLDDGPNCSHNALYDYMYENQYKATLFYIGSNVLDWPLEAQRGLADGHEICAHTWSHPYMTALTNEQVFAELYYSKKAIKQVLGVTVKCWRPPYGDVDDRVRWIANALGMRTILWTHDTSDWKVETLGAAAVEANYNAIIGLYATGAYAEAGPIVLTHEINGATMALVQKFLPLINSTFKGGVMPITVAQNVTEPYEEQGGLYVYPNAAQWADGIRSIALQSPSAASTSLTLILGTSTNTQSVATSTTITTAAMSTVFVVATASASIMAQTSSSRTAAAATATATLASHKVDSRACPNAAISRTLCFICTSVLLHTSLLL